MIKFANKLGNLLCLWIPFRSKFTATILVRMITKKRLFICFLHIIIFCVKLQNSHRIRLILWRIVSNKEIQKRNRIIIFGCLSYVVCFDYYFLYITNHLNNVSKSFVAIIFSPFMAKFKIIAFYWVLDEINIFWFEAKNWFSGTFRIFL